MNPTTESQFDIENGAIYVGFIGAVCTGCTWIESTHSLARGLLTGGCAIVLLLVMRALIHRSIR